MVWLTYPELATIVLATAIAAYIFGVGVRNMINWILR